MNYYLLTNIYELTNLPRSRRQTQMKTRHGMNVHGTLHAKTAGQKVNDYITSTFDYIYAFDLFFIVGGGVKKGSTH